MKTCGMGHCTNLFKFGIVEWLKRNRGVSSYNEKEE